MRSMLLLSSAYFTDRENELRVISLVEITQPQSSLMRFKPRSVSKAYALNHYNILTNIKNPKIESMTPALFRSRLLQRATRSYEIT